RVHAIDKARTIDVHTIRLDGQPLIAEHPVVYALDVFGQRNPATRRRALVVADPEDNLPGARSEIRVLANALSQQGWQTIELIGAAARSAAIRRQLPRVDLFHFAGHGDAGPDTATGLRLAHDQLLTQADVLATTQAPRWAVLSGCETGVSREGEPVAALGVGQSFVVAGSEGVLATSRPIDDRLALALAKHIYTEQRSPGAKARATPQAWSGPDVWRRALVALSRDEPQQDWAAYRILVP
ncbi:MAG: CHAT domain-containing protein, partial [Myxococcota bacterium]